MVLIIYVDSFCFVLSTAVVNQGIGLNTSQAVCIGAIYICLAFYMTTKVMLYLFLVERVVSIADVRFALACTDIRFQRIVRGHRKPRRKDRLYQFNFFGLLSRLNHESASAHSLTLSIQFPILRSSF